MKYVSTRGKAPKLDFQEVLLAGLASDGGLYVPEEIPQFSPQEIASWANLSYADLAKKIIAPFIGNSIPKKDLEKIIDETYRQFSHKAVAPLKQIKTNEWVLELFHGPTLAFKDFALQLLGRLLDYVLQKNNQKVVILGATSGDTGSAAIEGCKSCKNVDIFILHPKGRTSDIQRKQMTTVTAKNVYNVAVNGDFDNCQSIVKEIFGQREFLKKHQLVAVNSINWARIMAQIVYYFFAAISLGSPAKAVSFSVPTGNFGDVFAGYMAYRMGLPISQLIVATNKNDILSRFINDNDYSKKKVFQTLSPSMDIQVSSNFERLLYFVHDGDGAKVNSLMDKFKKDGKLSVAPGVSNEIRKLFSSYSIDDAAICNTIQQTFNECGEVIDPHTATAIKAAGILGKNDCAMVVLATAHPAKFPAAVKKAKVKPAVLPPHMSGLMKKKEKYATLKNDVNAIKSYILKNV